MATMSELGKPRSSRQPIARTYRASEPLPPPRYRRGRRSSSSMTPPVVAGVQKLSIRILPMTVADYDWDLGGQMRYASWEEVPDRLLALETPPTNDVDRIWREPRTRLICGSCGRHYFARTSDNPPCKDCRLGHPPRQLPMVDITGDQTICGAR